MKMAINPLLLPLREVGKMGRETTVPWTQQPAADGRPGRLLSPGPPSPGERSGDAGCGERGGARPGPPRCKRGGGGAAGRGAQRAGRRQMEKRVVNEAGSGTGARRSSSDRVAVARFPAAGARRAQARSGRKVGKSGTKRYSRAAIKQSHRQTESRRCPAAGSPGASPERGCAATPGLGCRGEGRGRRGQPDLQTPRLPGLGRICSRRVRAD